MPACRLYADDPVRDDRLLFFVYILTMSEKDLQLKVQTTGASTTTTTLDALVAEARHSSLPVIMKWLQNRCQIIVGMHDAVIRRAEGSEDLSEQSRTILAYRQWEREALGRVEFKVSI